MLDAVSLLTRYQSWLYVGVGLVGVFYVWRLWRARVSLEQTLGGLEREAALGRQMTAVGMLGVLGSLALGVYLLSTYIGPGLRGAATASATSQAPTPIPSPTPIAGSGGPIVVDSSGCDNPNATLLEPQPQARISGSFEVRGTASIENFAFYKFEISGAATNGLWVPLYVGNLPISNGSLGTFDASAYTSGEYAFRLVVMDNSGSFPLPCVVPVTVVNLSRPTAGP